MWGISAVELTIFWGEPWKDIECSEFNGTLWKQKILRRAVQTMEARLVTFQEEALPGLFMSSVLRACGVLFAGAEELKETRTIKMKQLAYWGL